MNFFKKTAHYFARKEFCRKALAENADLSIFKKKPSLRIVTGLVLIAVSYAIGLPAAIILSALAAAQGNVVMAAVGAPLLYGISWVMFMAGVYLAGPEYGRALSRWFARVILEKILGDETKAPYPLPPEGSGNKQPKS